ncbi:MAG: ribonuclease HI family protein [Candidatus Curtissbacteria bacterium]|nr:ribonuclease HI family protein [Candidatus Curtissbacteria bacterium]
MIKIFTDGGARGNPGPAAYGFVVKVDDKTVKKEGGYLGIATNNFAEYTALIKALGWAKKEFEGKDLNVFLDSQLVVYQLSGLYKIKNAKIRELVLEVRGLEASFGKVNYIHIPREKNKEADTQVNIALDAQ